jgi:hypothetical protein
MQSQGFRRKAPKNFFDLLDNYQLDERLKPVVELQLGKIFIIINLSQL